jgi:hypothetical protein
MTDKTFVAVQMPTALARDVTLLAALRNQSRSALFRELAETAVACYLSADAQHDHQSQGEEVGGDS